MKRVRVIEEKSNTSGLFDKIKKEMSLHEMNVYDVKLFNYGISQSTYKLKSDLGNFVLKLFDADRYTAVNKEILNLQFIAKKTSLAIIPLNNKPLRIGNKIGYYYKYFSGKMVSDIKINDIYFRFGKLVGEFDLAARGISFDKDKYYKKLFSDIRKEEVLFMNRAKEDECIAAWIQKGRDIINKYLNNEELIKVRIQYIHKDLHFHNVIYNKKFDKFFIIDTAGFSVNFLPREIAVIIGNESFKNGNKISYHVIENLLSGYGKYMGLTKEEIFSIPFFVIQKKIGELIFLNHQNKYNKISKRMYNKYTKISLNSLQVIVNNHIKLIEFFKSYVNEPAIIK